MKYLKYLMLVFLIFIGISCTKAIDIKAEEQAIKDVIESQTRSYMAKDQEKNSAFFVQDKSFIVLVAGKENYGYAKGWELADCITIYGL